MSAPERQPLLKNRLDVHDRKQFELKLEYEPAKGEDADYLVEAFFFLPTSLNITPETYPRHDFYADIHNYVRLKTPVVDLSELLDADSLPLARLERWLTVTSPTPEPELVYDAKMLSCMVRGALRRFSQAISEYCAPRKYEAGFSPEQLDRLGRLGHGAIEQVNILLQRFREFTTTLNQRPALLERTRASMRLVDEYLSLSVEQFFRRAVADMDRLPKTPFIAGLRKLLLLEVIREETYRKNHQLRSVLSPTGDNEEYMHRIGFLKKFCMNILFLNARPEQNRRNYEEILFALAAGVSMAFATTVAIVGQKRFPQASLNFSLVLIVGYMVKDRIKEMMRRIFSSVASRYLFDRSVAIIDPVTQAEIGTCAEKVDYGAAVRVPEDVAAMRRQDDFITVTQGELAEQVIRYQKKIALGADLLTRMSHGCTGVTDIIRINVDRLLRDMDNPEFALEYVDLEDLSVGRVRAEKSYQVDIVFRFTIEEGGRKRTTCEAARLVLDQNGIKRMLPLGPAVEAAAALRSVA